MSFFNQDEFKCKCGCGENKISSELVAKLEEARADAGVPFIITSAYRCSNHNKKVGGVNGSAHTLGLACDISIANNKEKILTSLKKYFVRIGIDNKRNFVHVDIDKSKPQLSWLYKEKSNA